MWIMRAEELIRKIKNYISIKNIKKAWRKLNANNYTNMNPFPLEAVVTKNVPTYAIVGGVPARVTKK